MTTYAFDPTGTLVANRIDNELLPIPSQVTKFKVIYPSVAPFYAEGNTLTLIKPDSSTQTLVYGTDYYAAYEFDAASMATGKKVCIAYAIINPTLVGSVRIASYQAFGSDWSPDILGIPFGALESAPGENPMLDSYEYLLFNGYPPFPEFSADQTNSDITTLADLSLSIDSITSKLAIANATRQFISSLATPNKALFGLDQVSNMSTASIEEHFSGSYNKMATTEGLRAYLQATSPAQNVVVPDIGENEIGYMFYTYNTLSAPQYLPTNGTSYNAEDYPELAALIGLDKIIGYEPVPNSPTNMSGHSASTLNDGRVFISGGYYGGFLSSAYIYNPTTNTYTTVANMPNATYFHASTTLPDGRVFICGGLNNGWVRTNIVYIYNPTTNTYTTLASLPTGKDGLGACTLPDGRVFICGGENGSGNKISEAHIYDPTTNTYTAVANLPTAKMYVECCTLSNGKVFICGGYDSNNKILSEAHIYDPTTNTYTAVANMPKEIGMHAITTMSNGNVFISGGYDMNWNKINSVYIYDPVKNIYTQSSNLLNNSVHHEVNGLPDGRVFICGGQIDDYIGNGNNAFITNLVDGTTFTTPIQPTISKLKSYIKSKL